MLAVAATIGKGLAGRRVQSFRVAPVAAARVWPVWRRSDGIEA